LEALISSHQGVVDVVVVGVPDVEDPSNDLVRAYIVRSTPSLSEEEIHEYVNNNVADFKRLRGGVFFVDVIPKVHY
jgi:4-coumarate--CoA ligase